MQIFILTFILISTIVCHTFIVLWIDLKFLSFLQIFEIRKITNSNSLANHINQVLWKLSITKNMNHGTKWSWWSTTLSLPFTSEPHEGRPINLLSNCLIDPCYVAIKYLVERWFLIVWHQLNNWDEYLDDHLRNCKMSVVIKLKWP